MTVLPHDPLAELFDPAKIDEIATRANEPDMNPATFRRDIGTLVLMLQQARHQLATVHQVHIRDIRALAGAEEATRQALMKQIEEAKARECTALCNDVETDRDELARELEKVRQEGTPGVMHEVDRAFYNVAIADRDRFAELFRRGGERRAALITRLRQLNYAEKLIEQLMTILGTEALGDPAKVSRDNVVDVLTALVANYRGYAAQHEVSAGLRHELALAMAENSQLKMDLAAADRAIDNSDSLEAVVLGSRIKQLEHELEATRRAKQENDERFMGERDEARQALGRLADDHSRLVNENHALNTEMDRAGRELLRQREQLTTQADLLSTWEQDYRTLESKHNGLLTASQAVGQQLAMALRHCDRARERRFADGELLHRAHGIIANAENFRHTLPCQHDHCKLNQHEIVIGDEYPPEPIGDPAWRDAAHRWNKGFHAREDAIRRPTASQADPLEGFVVRVINDGARERVELEHLGGGCVFEVSYQALPKTDTPLVHMLNDAYGHLLRAHSDEHHDDPAPAPAEVGCEDICHPSAGGCCGNSRGPSTEVDE